MLIRCCALILTCCFSLVGCNRGPDSPFGFSLPAGDAERGEAVFLKYGCLSCHTVKGLEVREVHEVENPIVLGGHVTRVKTYAELVTSVINPSHKIAHRHAQEHMSEDGQSLMVNYNDLLTVSELVDLVTYLETHYELIPYRPTSYGPYYPVSSL